MTKKQKQPDRHTQDTLNQMPDVEHQAMPATLAALATTFRELGLFTAKPHAFRKRDLPADLDPLATVTFHDDGTISQVRRGDTSVTFAAGFPMGYLKSPGAGQHYLGDGRINFFNPWDDGPPQDSPLSFERWGRACLRQAGDFSARPPEDPRALSPSLGPRPLWALLESGAPLLFVDVRDGWELEETHRHGAQHIPVGQLPSVQLELVHGWSVDPRRAGALNLPPDVVVLLDMLPDDRPLVFLSHHGRRAEVIATWLRRRRRAQGRPYEAVCHYKNGLHAFALEIDTALRRYRCRAPCEECENTRRW